MMPTYLVDAPVVGGNTHENKIGRASIEVEADSPEHARELAGEISTDEWDIEMEWGLDIDDADITEVE